MRLLLDTHIFIWMLRDDPRLAASHRALIVDPSHEKYLSVASVWEMAIKVKAGKLSFPLTDMEKRIQETEILIMPVSLRHATALADADHGDPFDRMLVAQCVVEDMRMLTVDRILKHHPVAIG